MDRQHRYQAVGGCIYCGEPADSDEHIIARSLGGMLILPKASCAACRDITSAVEGQVIDRMFGAARRQFKLPTRHPKRLKPPLRTSIDGIERLFADEDFPGLIVTFKFDLPAILGMSGNADEVFTGGVAVNILPEFGERLNRARSRHGNKVEFPQGIEALMFGRMLAKIAHAYAVAELGQGGFAPTLPEVIRHPDPPFLGRLVGGALDGVAPGPDLHEVFIDPRIDPRFVVVTIRLFSDRDLPAYWVVAGLR